MRDTGPRRSESFISELLREKHENPISSRYREKLGPTNYYISLRILTAARERDATPGNNKSREENVVSQFSYKVLRIKNVNKNGEER